MTMIEFLLARIAEDKLQPAHLRPHWGGCGYTLRPGVLPCTCGRNASEVAAKRAVIEMVQDGGDYDLEIALGHLAAVYSDHPDYQQQWPF